MKTRSKFMCGIKSSNAGGSKQRYIAEKAANPADIATRIVQLNRRNCEDEREGGEANA